MSTVEGIEVLREIGRGNYGTVWLVRRPGSCRNLVLKCVDLTHCSAAEVEAARQEVRILAGLRHPSIVSYKGSFEVSRQLNLLMGYCAGGDMASLIRRQRGHLFPEVKVVRWLIQITMALQYLHSHHILHRDLKTRNIFLTRSGLIKLGDFGISRILGSSQDMATTLVGTPYYMSPELFAGLPYNHKSDVWALGCCLYELATLRHAFPARNIPGLISKISKGKIVGLHEQYSDDLRHLVLSLMTRSPEHRPSAAQILRLPYIRQHMSLFLKDTSDVEEVIGHEQLSIKEKRLPEVLQDSEVCAVQPSCEGGQSVVNINERVGQHKHSIARRCCKIVPSEFESLQIAGDKIRLEERDRGETKPSGIKECHCPRREKQQQHPCSTGHLHSQSRTRRRGIRELESNGDITQGQSSPSAASSLASLKALAPPRSSLSARERRRQQRRGATENGSYFISANEHLEEERSDSEGSYSQYLTEDSDECSNSDTSTATPPHEYEEEEEFLQSLSSTLTEASSPKEGDSEHSEEDNTGHLEGKIAQLEEYLVSKMGKVQGMLVMKVLKEEEEDEVQGNWEARLREVEQLVGSKLGPEVGSTAWHLHLCYVFQHT